jgi:hypothetical protein
LAAVVLYVLMGVMIVFSLAVAFEHTHDLSERVLPGSAQWQHWISAVDAELLPTASFIALQAQWRSGRPIGYAAVVGVFSLLVSGAAQLFAAGVVFPGARFFFAVWPALAAVLLVKLVWSEVTAGVAAKAAAVVAAQAAAQAARAAAQVARQEAQQAAQAAERAALLRQRTEEDRAARAAEREAAREAAALQATRAHELALAAQQGEAARATRAAQDRARLAEQQADIAARQLSAAQRAAQSQPVYAGKTPATRNAGPVTAQLTGSRQPVTVTAVQAQNILNGLGPVPREEAVRAVAHGLGQAPRTARQFVPADWPAVRTAVVPQRGKGSPGGHVPLQLVGADGGQQGG